MSVLSVFLDLKGLKIEKTVKPHYTDADNFAFRAVTTRIIEFTVRYDWPMSSIPYYMIIQFLDVGVVDLYAGANIEF